MGGVVVLVVILLLVLPFETFIACCDCCDDGFKDTGVVKAEQTAAEHIAIAAIMRTILFIVSRLCRCLGRCSCRRSIF